MLTNLKFCKAGISEIIDEYTTTLIFDPSKYIFSSSIQNSDRYKKSEVLSLDNIRQPNDISKQTVLTAYSVRQWRFKIQQYNSIRLKITRRNIGKPNGNVATSMFISHQNWQLVILITLFFYFNPLRVLKGIGTRLEGYPSLEVSQDQLSIPLSTPPRRYNS
jgi:hypothetical protein